MAPRTELIKNSFIAGEFSPNLLGRSDLAKYHSACESIENFVVKVQGGVRRRSGTRYICDTANANRLIPFKVGIGQQYIIELGQQYIRFYTNDGQITNPDGSPYQINSPYLRSELWEIHYAQQISVMYLVHPNHPPQKLIRLADTNWRLLQPLFHAAPAIVQDQDVGTDKLANVNIVANVVNSVMDDGTTARPIFILGDTGKALVAGTGVGFIVALGGVTDTDGTTGATLYSTATLDIVDVFDSTHYDHGDWFLRGGPLAYFSPGAFQNGTLFLWHGQHKFSFGKVASVYATTTHPTDASWQTVNGSSYQNVTYQNGFTDCFRTIDLNSYVPFSGGYGQITQVTNSTQVQVRILSIASEYETDAWGGPIIAPAPPGSWSFEVPAFGPGNYPHAVCFFGDRLYFAGTLGTSTNTFWGSGVGDYENFALGTLDSSGIRYTINSSTFEHIHWMTVYQGNIVMGGVEHEYVINGGAGQAVVSAGAPITPQNINVITQSAYGVADVQAITVDNDLLFIQKAGKKTYRFAFNAITSSYGSDNLNVLNEIITDAGIKEMVYQDEPIKIVWFTDNSGQLLGLTYDKQQDVWAWHRHNTGQDTFDRVISIEKITAKDQITEELWMLCQRTRAGSIVYTIEVMDINMTMDCGLLTTFDEPVTSLTDLQYLNGRPVTVVADGILLPTVIMDISGVYYFPFDFSAKTVQVGINYTASLLTVRPEPRASVQGLLKRWIKIWARLYSSLGLTINDQYIPIRRMETIMNTATPPFTGDVQINNLGFDRAGRILVQQTEPFYCSILALFGPLEVSDGV